MLAETFIILTIMTWVGIFFLINERLLAKFQHVDIVTSYIELKVLGHKINLRDIYSRKIYEFCVNDLQNSFSMQVKDDHSKFNYTDEELRDIFVRPRRTTILNKHREFQYKLIHGVIYTKEQLFKFGFVGNNLCSFCQQEVETYSHVFLHCKKVKDIWKNVIIHYDLIEIRNMDWGDIFVGLSRSSTRMKFVNSLIIMLKYISFKSRTTGTLPLFNKIQNTYLEYMNAETILATTRGKFTEMGICQLRLLFCIIVATSKAFSSFELLDCELWGGGMLEWEQEGGDMCIMWFNG